MRIGEVEKVIYKCSYDELIDLSVEIGMLRNNSLSDETYELTILKKKFGDEFDLNRMKAYYELINSRIVEINEKNKRDLIDKSDEEKGSIKIVHSIAGYLFMVVSANGQILLESNVYSRLDGCKGGVQSFLKNINATIDLSNIKKAPSHKNPKYIIKIDDNQHYRFELIAANGDSLCESKPFGTEKECLNRLERIKIIAKNNVIENA